MVQKRAHVVLPEGLLADIDQLFGKGKRSAFLTEIAERELRRQKLLRILDDTAGCWKDEDHPELKDGSDAWVRKLRSGWDSRLPKNGVVDLYQSSGEHIFTPPRMGLLLDLNRVAGIAVLV